jgi:hypothetical protein
LYYFLFPHHISFFGWAFWWRSKATEQDLTSSMQEHQQNLSSASTAI